MNNDRESDLEFGIESKKKPLKSKKKGMHILDLLVVKTWVKTQFKNEKTPKKPQVQLNHKLTTGKAQLKKWNSLWEGKKKEEKYTNSSSAVAKLEPFLLSFDSSASHNW